MATKEEKVKYGLSGVHLAPVDENFQKDAPAYKTPFPLQGAVTFSPEAQQDVAKFFADDKLYFTVSQTTSYDGDLEVAKFPDKVLTDILGNIKEANGGIYDVDGATAKDFALMGQVKTDVGSLRFCYYQCTGGKPTESYGTVEEGAPEIPTETMALSCTSVKVPTATDAKEVYAFAYKLREGETGYDTFFDQVPFGEEIPKGA